MGFGYLAAGRMLSLISLPVSCLLVSLAVWQLNGDPRAALLAAFFCMALFCVADHEYVGSDDPPMFGQVFSLWGLLVYISGPPRFPRLALTALLFVLGGNIKHSPVEFPLAALLDLAFTERKRVLQYLPISAVLLALSIYANTAVGGPFFAADVLTPRVFHIAKAFIQFMEYGLGSLSLAMVAAAIWSAAGQPVSGPGHPVLAVRLRRGGFRRDGGRLGELLFRLVPVHLDNRGVDHPQDLARANR